MPSAQYLIIYALAVTRLTGIMVTDQISLPIRHAITKRLNIEKRSHRALIYLLGAPEDDSSGCPWCMSIWVAAATAPPAIEYASSRYTLWALVALAASQVVGMVSSIGRR